jgi:NADH:ubiquinone oxidoreductase subunit D
MRQSINILSQVINNIPSGKVKVENYKLVPPTKKQTKFLMESLIRHYKLFSSGVVISKGESYLAIEAPKGEFGIYLVSNSTELPYRCKIRSPGFMHLQAINYLAKGHLIADVVTIIGTLDIVLGEVDR